jgi:hypothetical protein
MSRLRKLLPGTILVDLERMRISMPQYWILEVVEQGESRDSRLCRISQDVVPPNFTGYDKPASLLEHRCSNLSKFLALTDEQAEVFRKARQRLEDIKDECAKVEEVMRAAYAREGGGARR